jgi:hypothetical protein
MQKIIFFKKVLVGLPNEVHRHTQKAPEGLGAWDGVSLGENKRETSQKTIARTFMHMKKRRLAKKSKQNKTRLLFFGEIVPPMLG